MCGIVGAISNSPGVAGQVSGMRDWLRHRGPDETGCVSLPGAEFGHCRLSIIDLSAAGAQPMWDVTGQACITYNGEIYNFSELRAECLARGAEFRSHSDTEVILNLYLLDGTRAFERLNGMFAFALFDARSRETFIVRDPMGIKPLYYAVTERGVFFASELGAMIEGGAIPFAVDDDALAAYLQLDYVPTPDSIVRGVQKLESGHFLIVDGKWTIRTERYATWDPPIRSAATPDECLAEFGTRIKHAVQRQLVADVPVGVFLSGGIDSTIVAAIAAELCGTIDTFSVAFAEESFDERPFFNVVAEQIGSRQHTAEITARDMLSALPDLPRILSEPVADGSIFPTALLCRHTRSSVKVALSGDGADELFGGYPTYTLRTTAQVLSMLPAGVRRSAAAVAAAVLPAGSGNLTFGYKVQKFLRGLHRDPIERNHLWLGTFTSDEVAQLIGDRFSSVANRRLHQRLTGAASGLTGVEALLRTDQRFYMQDQVLVKVDRASMAAGLEVRVPFLDREIVTFARALPPSEKVSAGVTKKLLRRYVAQRFPPAISGRPKKGFGAPLAVWFRKELKALTGDVLLGGSASTFFRRDVVERLLMQHWSGRADHRKKIFNLLQYVLWHDYFRERVEAGGRHQGSDCA
jgi:asparagine synthase (glutamine-hydrolysing)